MGRDFQLLELSFEMFELRLQCPASATGDARFHLLNASGAPILILRSDSNASGRVPVAISGFELL